MVSSSTRQFGFLALAALATTPALGGDSEVVSAAQPEYSLSLQYEGAAPSSPDDYDQLYRLALAIVESSESNSRDPRWNWELADILRDYRRAVDGRYLLVSFAKPRLMKSSGGELTVKEIVIGLNGSQYASSLHTVDDEGRIVGHAMYSGDLCVKMFKLVTSMERHLTMRWSGP